MELVLMLPEDAVLISVDDHIIEHPTLWSDRLPAAMREEGPRVVELDNGDQQWRFEGVVAGTLGLSAVAGTDFKERGLEPMRFDDMRPGCYDPVARLADMDIDGVGAQLNFANWSGFAGGRFFRAKDKQLANACVRAYNDFVIEEWWAAAPDRYIPMMITPFWDAEAAEAEVKRCAGRGIRAVSFPDNPALMGLPSIYTDYWDSFFATVSEAGLPICMHFGAAGNIPAVSEDAPHAVTTILMGTTSFSAMTELLLSPVFHKFPELKVCFSEGQIGWMPFALQRIDQVWEHYRFYNFAKTMNGDVLPSDLFRDHIFGCFIDDQIGIDMRARIGVNNILWEGDYPHADSLFPNARTVAEKILVDVPDQEARQIAELNARTLFNFPAVA
jgi:predicted TIM-barrel fold metal-dependent hydrolase